MAILNPTAGDQSLKLEITGATLSGKGTLWRLASVKSNEQNLGISSSPVELVPGPLTFPRFSVSIYKLAVKE